MWQTLLCFLKLTTVCPACAAILVMLLQLPLMPVMSSISVCRPIHSLRSSFCVMNYIYIFAGHWMNKMCHEPCQTSDDGLLLCGERDGLHIVQEPVVLDEAITFGGWHSFQFTHHGFHTLPKLNFTWYNHGVGI